MIAAGLDIETTGLSFGDHRIIELYIGLWDTSTKLQTKEFCKRIDPQRSVSVEASRVHHIYLTDLIGKPIWNDIAGSAHSVISKADFIVAHNGIEFDIPFLNYEFKRVGLSEINLPVVDTMVQGRHATPRGKLPRLQELCFAYGVDYDPAKAHAADYDVKVMMNCFFLGSDWKFFKVPETELAA
jgi:DNA polymerase-3 subunit epsilon